MFEAKLNNYSIHKSAERKLFWLFTQLNPQYTGGYQLVVVVNTKKTTLYIYTNGVIDYHVTLWEGHMIVNHPI